jgi:molybdate/tungstate transport system substrate-binding protein
VSAPVASAAKTGERAASASGGINVAYAGSLLKLNEEMIGPAFTKATGIAYEGEGAGSFGLAQEIRSGEIAPNVFESIGAGPIALLEPRYTRWYLSVAASPIVVAYNPHSRFAAQLEAIARHQRPLSDLFQLMAQPGFELGRTNPATDPQGQAFALMVKLAIAQLHLPPSMFSRILGPLETSPEIFSETALEPRLEAGQLDAASAFRSQAVQLHLPYIALPASIDFGSPSDAALYAKAQLDIQKVGVVHGVPLIVDVTTIGTSNATSAARFVAFQLNPKIRAIYAHAGYELVSPSLHGDLAAVPALVRKAVGA